ncbi:MAG: hypothetical protein JKY60_18815 [Kordiimonadaceae bacterium]|nr:hypothetical protein [Kordiimonadaceae bacterium]
MITGSLNLYDSALAGLLSGRCSSLANTSVTAVLLSPGYAPDFAAHSSFADIVQAELKGAAALRHLLTGTRINGAAFLSDSLLFGDPVTVGPVRYVAMVMGTPKGLGTESALLGFLDVAPEGAALEAQRARFEIIAPAEGWFRLSRT